MKKNWGRGKSSPKIRECAVRLPKLHLHTTHPRDLPDFWCDKGCRPYLLLYQKSSAWVVRRRRYGHFTKKFTKNGQFTKKFTKNGHFIKKIHQNERITAYFYKFFEKDLYKEDLRENFLFVQNALFFF